MKCQDVQDRLNDYVDGDLAEAEFQDLELHLHGCGACREQERLLRSLLAEAAALPRELAPPRDLWPGIAGRISEPSSAAAPRGVPWWSLGALAAAAAVVAALAAALLQPRASPTGPRAAEAPAAGASLPGASVRPAADGSEPSFQQAEAEYVRATSELMAALDSQRGSLSPETLAAVGENLRIIDGALDQLREALRKDPANLRLTHMLRATHRKKVDVLRRVMKIKA